jgi:hypothetical protein
MMAGTSCFKGLLVNVVARLCASLELGVISLDPTALGAASVLVLTHSKSYGPCMELTERVLGYGSGFGSNAYKGAPSSNYGSNGQGGGTPHGGFSHGQGGYMTSPGVRASPASGMNSPSGTKVEFFLSLNLLTCLPTRDALA